MDTINLGVTNVNRSRSRKTDVFVARRRREDIEAQHTGRRNHCARFRSLGEKTFARTGNQSIVIQEKDRMNSGSTARCGADQRLRSRSGLDCDITPSGKPALASGTAL
ncbi:hypothetical protein NKJ26_31085 [Mesorhizobium sp. M0152]|uniref:hypothetical protein n=1 Tax=Mesorhizobium sp. M0152 TaxID=2956898 RepID=UPI00333A4EC5